ncbi:type II and III secretion system protein family protein [Photobacterium sp. OFAV2-7]|uniref:type II and III secretion system protein family protein n=1 Tax=Photobacterium sp. OFAV2-7 TaxID=2917748 RepID=UPI001EF6FB14|nr:type II and III secretion system protein family protein [Photobacterium sp. OFAV2-7]MCG7585610.1 type II and III secretion system protein family protein [Photobacterium sp. OFAV2-7]
MINKILGGFILLCMSFSLQAKVLDVVLDKARLVNLPHNAKSIFISSNEVADYQALTNTKIMVFGKKAGATSLYVLDANENVIYSATVKVSHNVVELNELVAKEFPDALVNAESTAGKLFLKGQVPTPTMAEKIVRLAEGYVSPQQMTAAPAEGEANQPGNAASSASSEQPVAQEKDELINQLVVTMPTQVNLRIRIAEVSRKVSNKLGIKWGSQGTGLGAGTFAFLDNYGGVPGGTNPASWADLSVIVDALATNGMMSVLAEPNLTALSGERASFLVGGEVPLPLVYSDNATVEYKPFGVRLDFKPTVLSANRISLQVEPEVSTVSTETNVQIGGPQGSSSFPTFVTRRASTTIELASGQSFALGGLLQSKEIEQLQKTPFIGDIPILGSLFRSNEFQREETELIIIATAYLVQPTRADTLPLPTDGLIPLSDVERLLGVKKPKTHSETDSDTIRSDNRQPRLLGDNGFYY